jgi:alkylation response protein AidB-like acyl-CoA dehydrogenase
MGHYKSNLRDIEFNLFEVLRPRRGARHRARSPRSTATPPASILARSTAGPRGARRVVRGPTATRRSSTRRPHGAAARGVQEELPGLDGRRVLAAGPARGARRHAGPVRASTGRSRAGARRQPGDLDVRRRADAFAGVVTATATSATRSRPAHRRQAAGAPRWCSPSPTPAPTSAPAAPRPPSNDDGTWNIEGVKRFITSAEHDLADNIIHLVLARPEGVEGVGGPGTKGLSPVHRAEVPLRPRDRRADRRAQRRLRHQRRAQDGHQGLQHLRAHLRREGPASGGWLLGEVHDGIAQMFQVIENARMMVGTKAIATLSTGYLNALDYAKERVQGADLTQAADKTAPRVTITHHPDVRRSLMTQKSFAEAMRALVLYTASWQDQVMIAEHGDGETTTSSRCGQRPAAADRQGLRLGALLGAARHRVAADLRRLRLPAGLPDRAVRPRRQDRHPLRGHHRDPGQDFFFRKIVKDQGQALGHLAKRSRRSSRARPATAGSRSSASCSPPALEDANAIVGA